MKITVEYIPEEWRVQFADYGNGKRMYLQNKMMFWYPSVGWCPHLNSGCGECLDCGIVLEMDDDNE